MGRKMTLLEKWIKETFEYLHEHPEISWEETATTNYVATILEQQGCNVTTFDDCTGVVGEYGNFVQDIPVIAIRADIDALWQEVDGVFQPNHSCGHDAHMAIVLGLARKLAETPSLKDNIAIKFIFQPAEEKGTGALKMVEKGVVDNVDYLFGIHLRPQEETPMGYAAPVIVHGAIASYEVEIVGEDAHAARPHLNVNAIEVASEIVNMLGTIHLNPHVPHSVKMTNIAAGGKSTNIIPGRATFALDLRAQDNDVMDILEQKVQDIFQAIRALYGVKVQVINKEKVPAARVNEQAIKIIEQAIRNVLSAAHVEPPLLTPGGDDFHFYTVKKPQLKATMVGLGCDLQPGLHHPYMTFNEDALISGTNILYEAIQVVYRLND